MRVVKHGNLHLLRAPNPQSSVTAQQHLGNTVVRGEIQLGCHSPAASSTEISTKLLVERCLKCLLGLLNLWSWRKLSELTDNHILMPEQANWVSPAICYSSLFPFCEVEITYSCLMRFYEVNGCEVPRHSDDEGRINMKILCKHSNAKCLMQIPCSQPDFLSSLAQFLCQVNILLSWWKSWPLYLKYLGWIATCVSGTPPWYAYLYKDVWVLSRSSGDLPCCASLLLGRFRRVFSFLMLRLY